MGTIMIPNGCWNGNVSTSVMCTYTMTPPNTFGAVDMPILSNGLGQLPDNLAYYLFAHSTQRNSLMLYGGLNILNGTIPNHNLYEYLLSAKAWSPLLQTQGTGPGDVSVGCMVQSKEQKEKRYIFFPNCFLCIFLKFHGQNPTPFFF